MLLRVQVLPTLFAAALLQPACATSAMPTACNVSGDMKALPGMSARAICDRFTQDLSAVLGEHDTAGDVAIALTLYQRGRIEARLSVRHDGQDITYPRIAVDVLDRALQSDDITRLAQAAAQVLHGPAAAAAAPTKDK